MNRNGVVKFERDAHGQLAIVLLVQGVPIARSGSAVHIAAEVAFRDLDSLYFDESLVVNVPTDKAMLARAANASLAPPEVARAAELIAACAW